MPDKIEPPPLPAAPKRPLPTQAYDCHAHVIGPFDRFPLQPTRSFEPPLAPAAIYLAMLDRVGMAHGVLVQPSVYGTDNRALLDALGRAPDRLRGVAVIDSSVNDATLDDMHARGVRALRFVQQRSQPGQQIIRGTVGFLELTALAPRMAARGWHAKLFAELDVLLDALPDLTKLGVPLVIDHFGLAGKSGRPLSDPAVGTLKRYLADGLIWLKLTMYRNSTSARDYSNMAPFHRAFVAANPDRVIWGSDWPFINLNDTMPDVGHLIDLLVKWTDKDVDLRKILVDNPAALYGF